MPLAPLVAYLVGMVLGLKGEEAFRYVGTGLWVLPEKPTRQCVSCFKEYDRTKTALFRPLGVFDNYCICESCLEKDMHGWGLQQ